MRPSYLLAALCLTACTQAATRPPTVAPLVLACPHHAPFYVRSATAMAFDGDNFRSLPLVLDNVAAAISQTRVFGHVDVVPINPGAIPIDVQLTISTQDIHSGGISREAYGKAMQIFAGGRGKGAWALFLAGFAATSALTLTSWAAEFVAPVSIPTWGSLSAVAEMHVRDPVTSADLWHHSAQLQEGWNVIVYPLYRRDSVIADLGLRVRQTLLAKLADDVAQSRAAICDRLAPRDR